MGVVWPDLTWSVYCLLLSGNISAKYLAEHTARIRAWRQGEVHLLVKEQESAVKAVRLERLVGNIGEISVLTPRRRRSRRRSGGEESQSEEEMTEELTGPENRRIVSLTESPRAWLHPGYNR